MKKTSPCDELEVDHWSAMGNSGTGGFGLEGLMAKRVWQAHSENLLKPFTPGCED